MLRCALVLVVGMLFAAVPAAAPAADPTGPQAYHGVRVTGENPEKPPASLPATEYAGPELGLRYSYVGRDTAEPMVAVDDQGVAFFSAGAFDAAVPGLARQELRRSTDGGITWQPVQAPFFTGGGEVTTLDPYVTADALTGRVFAVTLLGGGSYLSYTDDSGQTWTESAMSSPGANDHQSLSTAKPPEGLIVGRPADTFPNLVYYCVNHVSDARCTRSSDGGQTFVSTGGPAYLQSGEGEEGQQPGVCSALHGHLVGDSEGRVFLPAGHCGLPTVAISEDAGMTWTRKVISQEIRSATTHTAMAVDKADNVYYTWFDPTHRLPYLSVSTDHGETWSEPLMIAPPGVFESNFPTMVAGDAGRIAITFPGSTYQVKRDLPDGEDDPDAPGRPWFSYVVMSTNALDANPTFLSNVGGPPGDPVHRGNCGPGRCGNMFDFLEVTVSPTDASIWASATDTCTAENDCHVDRDVGPADAEGVAIRQVSGPKLVGDGFLGSYTAPAQPPAPPIAATPSAPSAKKVSLACNRTRSRTRPARCRVRLAGAPGGTAVSLRLFRGKVLVASGSAKLKAGRGVARVRGVRKGKLPVGRYRLLVTVGLRGTTPSRAERTLRLRN